MSLSRFTLPAIALILGLVLGFFVNEFILPASLVPPETTKPQQESVTETEKNLPISLELLRNPIIYEWRGSVQGKLTAKDEHSFVLQDEQGNTILITSRTSDGDIFRTIFEKRTESAFEEVPFGEISLGTELRGDFWIFKGGDDRAVGGRFEIVED